MGRGLCLKRSADFRKAFKEGRRFSSPRFALYVCKNALQTARLGVSISKSHFKLATRRNRLRRVAKEVFKSEVRPRLKGYDFVVASKASFSRSNISEAVKELKRLIAEPKG